jgi:hypothetical protein
VSSAVSASVTPPQICRSTGCALRQESGKTASRGCEGTGKRPAIRTTISRISTAAVTARPAGRRHPALAAGAAEGSAGTGAGIGAPA